MKASVLAVAILVMVALPAAAGGGHCDADMAAVDTALGAAKLSDSDMEKVKAARASAEEFHTAKKEEECEKALSPALAILGIKDKHAH